VGVVATLAHYIILVALVEGFEVSPITAAGTGALAGAFTSYFLNRRFTFGDDLPHSITMPRFFTVAGFAVISNVVFMKLLAGYLQLPYLLAQVITTIILITITFGLNKIWSFRAPHERREH